MEEMLSLSKTFSLVYFFIIYCCILFWVFRKKNRKRLEEHRHIPLAED